MSAMSLPTEADTALAQDVLDSLSGWHNADDRMALARSLGEVRLRATRDERARCVAWLEHIAKNPMTPAGIADFLRSAAKSLAAAPLVPEVPP